MKRYNSKNVIKNRMLKKLKRYVHEVFIGVIVGIIVLIFTPWVNSLVDKRDTKKKLKENLYALSIGMSYNYINSIFGNPIVEHTLSSVTSRYEKKEYANYLSAGYKLEDCVLLCLYEDKNIIAFAVVVQTENLYRINPNICANIDADCEYLLDFTYSDISDSNKIYEMLGSLPANNSDYLYYYECYFGAGPLDYNYYIVGNYKYNYGGDDLRKLYVLGYLYSLSDISDKDLEEYYELRKKVYPNVFGIVSSEYVDEFDFVDDIVYSRENAKLLFR